ncbi:MAG: glutathione S-transferase N-terminal domain-containing protein [Xanthomonadaceae bacterium]|nr:glutathione S-transferase N-terminal domain-containing protein [Xanthomonadaceae bacterium]
MKLYYSPGACSLADHIALEWIGKPYEAVRVTREERYQPEYLAINPAGAVPALEHDGWVLTQNAAILNYLADLHPESGLGGDGSAKSRAEVNKWLAFANSDVHPAFHPIFGSTAYLEEAALIDKSKDAARSKVRKLYERADEQLKSREWIAGDTRSIADPYLYVTYRWARGTGVDLSGLDNLAAFAARIEADPAVQKVLKDEGLS